MKTKYFLIICSFISMSAYAQEPADALRYSYLTQQGGTARNQAIGGAGASLGGEFSSLFINPAGLGFYKTGDFVLTPGVAIKTNNSNYLNSGNSTTHSNFNLGATGLVFSAPAERKNGNSFTIAIGVNRLADFSNHIYYSGINKTELLFRKIFGRTY